MELHVNLAELLGFLFKTHGQAFLPAFREILLPSIMEMARPESLAEDRKVQADFFLIGKRPRYSTRIRDMMASLIFFMLSPHHIIFVRFGWIGS